LNLLSHFPFPNRSIQILWALLAVSVFAPGCGLHRPTPLDPGKLPSALQTQPRIPDHFTTRAVLTLPDAIPPGGSLQLAGLVSKGQGLRLAALSPMGTPLFEMLATPGLVQIREAETGKEQKTRSLETLTRKTLGLALSMEEFTHLLAGEFPLPPWTAVVSEAPDVFLLHEGRHLRARLVLDAQGEILRMERIHRGVPLYALTSLSKAPRIWAIESGDHAFRLRIRYMEVLPGIGADRFLLP